MQITKAVMIMMTMIKTMPIKIIILEPSLKEKEIVEGQNQYKKKIYIWSLLWLYRQRNTILD